MQITFQSYVYMCGKTRNNPRRCTKYLKIFTLKRKNPRNLMMKRKKKSVIKTNWFATREPINLERK